MPSPGHLDEFRRVAFYNETPAVKRNSDRIHSLQPEFFPALGSNGYPEIAATDYTQLQFHDILPHDRLSITTNRRFDGSIAGKLRDMGA